ncbi:MAG: hypothetical protein IJ863_05705 [Spirochaetales bacterium]|nr:hypothetical protein [Spirochaetales bacterium]
MKKRNDPVTVDRMRYIKNKFSSNLCYLALLFDVFFFVLLYRQDRSTYYYSILIGASILYNLVFLLAGFLASEGVKTYNEKFSYLLIVLGAIQFIRIFIYPMRAHTTTIQISGVDQIVMSTSVFLRCVVYLVLSGVCCLVSAFVGLQRSRTLKAYMATLGEEKRRD